MVQVDVVRNAPVLEDVLDAAEAALVVADALDATDLVEVDAQLYVRTLDAGLDPLGFLVVLREDGMVLPGRM